jgi:glycerophosphoryl diester phosphodiesterase
VPAVVAHRGYSAVAPENTLAAIAAAGRLDVEWIEIDVSTSRDGVPYVLHDATVNRTTSGSGALAELDSADVDALDAGSWFSPAYAGQRVPSLTSVVELGVPLLVEVKAGDLTEIARVLRTATAPVMVQSFDERALAAIGPEFPRGLLRGPLDDDPIAVARSSGVQAYNPYWEAIEGETVSALQGAGVQVMAWTADTPEAWSALCDAGVDGIITNRPGALAGWLTGR